MARDTASAVRKTAGTTVVRDTRKAVLSSQRMADQKLNQFMKIMLAGLKRL